MLVITHYNPSRKDKFSGSLLILIGLILSIGLLFASFMMPLVRLGLIGLVSFTFVLFGAYFLTKYDDFGCGEFRKAITISILAVFFASLALGDQITIAQDSVLGQVFNNFWAILSTVIAFYFAARVIENKKNGTE